MIRSQNLNTSCVPPSPARSSALLASLSSPGRGGTSRGDLGTTGKLNGSIGAAVDKKEDAETLGTPQKGVGSAGVGPLMGLRGSPQCLGGFRGGRGTGGKPSPASRLGFVDRKWLERCQVFGELGAEVKPGAGNQEIDVEKRAERERGRETDGKMHRDGKEEMDAEEARSEMIDSGRDVASKSISSDKIVSDSLQHTGKSRRGEEEMKKKGGEEMETRLTSPPVQEDNEISHKPKGTKKRGRKRQREGDDTKGETPEEGGVKKRRRNGKKKEESSDVNPSPAQEGGKKRRRKKKGDEDEEAEEKKETKEPKKVSQFICFHLILCFFKEN